MGRTWGNSEPLEGRFRRRRSVPFSAMRLPASVLPASAFSKLRRRGPTRKILARLEQLFWMVPE